MFSRFTLRTVALTIGGFLMVIAVILASFGAWILIGTAPHRSGTGQFSGNSEEIIYEKTLLMLGVDGDGHNLEGQRTDSVLLVRLISGRVDLLSFPRDLLVPMPECTGMAGEEKLNGIFAHSSRMAGVDAGAECLSGAIQDMTNLPIDDYVVMNMDSVVTLVDQLGGIELCLAQSEVDDGIIPDITDPGCHHVNGTQALRYAQTRKFVDDGSDLSRLDRQHIMLEAVIERTSEVDPFREFPLFLRLAGTVKHMTETSLRLAEAREVTRIARTIAASDLGSAQTIPIVPADDGINLRLSPSADAYLTALHDGSPLPTHG